MNLKRGIEPMAKYCPENEKVKRDYAFFLETAEGKQSVTVDAVLKAIQRFEISTGFKPFKKFHVAQIRAFRATLAEETTPGGKPLSAATITSTLKHLRAFFLWLSREPGFRQAVNSNDTLYFTPTEQDRRIAGARRERPVASVEDIKATLAAMPSASHVQQRDRALLAFALLSGARDGALASFRLKHVNLAARSIFHDGREVHTKGRKTFTSTFFPVGPEPEPIFADYLHMLKSDLGFGPDDPLFPSTAIGHDADRGFAVQGLTRDCWSTTQPIRRIFGETFAAAGLPSYNPHSLRKTLVLLGERMCRTPEEWKSWSQNLGHESEATTFLGYGEVPYHRQAEIMAALAKPRANVLPSGVDIAALKAFVQSAEEAGAC